MVKSSK